MTHSATKMFGTDEGIEYTSVATAIPHIEALTEPLSDHELPSAKSLKRPTSTNLPEAENLTWTDDFFDNEDDEDIIAVFDFDYATMESYYVNVGWAYLAGVALIYYPAFLLSLVGCTPCFMRKNVRWTVNAQHVAITRDGIRFVRDRRKTCWGLSCTDAGRSSKTVPFDKITDCDIEEPAGNTCFCIKNVLATVNIDTASSGGPRHELQISGLKDPHGFKKLVWAMKRANKHHEGQNNNSAPIALPMVREEGMLKEQSRQVEADNAETLTLLREIRDELRELRNLKANAAKMTTRVADEEASAPANSHEAETLTENIHHDVALT